MSASCPQQNFNSSLQFPSLFLSSLGSFSILFLRAKLGKCMALWFVLTPDPHSNDWWNRKTHSKFANTKRDTTNYFGYKFNKRCIVTSSNFNTLILSHSISSSKDYQSSRKERESSCIVFSPSTKGHFHVIVMQLRQRNEQKSITHMQSSSVVKPIFLFRGHHQGFQ